MMSFRKLSYSLLGIGLLLIAKLGFASAKPANSAIILESNDSLPDTHYHGSHKSHCSHASHYSSHSIYETDSIQSVSFEIQEALKDLMAEKHKIVLHRCYLANSKITGRPFKDTLEDIPIFPTLVIIGRDMSNDSNILIYVTLEKPNQIFSWSSLGCNRIRTNNIQELYKECPTSAHQYDLSYEVVSYINLHLLKNEK